MLLMHDQTIRTMDTDCNKDDSYTLCYPMTDSASEASSSADIAESSSEMLLKSSAIFTSSTDSLPASVWPVLVA
jgi:hypothetical protein